MRKRPLHSPDHDPRPHKFRRPLCDPARTDTNECTKFYLNVLICRPDFGKYHHWAFQLQNLSTSDGTIVEVQGCPPALEVTSYQCRRHYYSLKIIKSIYIAEFHLAPASFANLAHALEHCVPVRNDSVEWTAQDYVFDVLDMLEDEWWIDSDDDDYARVRRKLDKMHGPVDLVQKAVMLYPNAVAGEESNGDSSHENDFDIQSMLSGPHKESDEDG